MPEHSLQRRKLWAIQAGLIGFGYSPGLRAQTIHQADYKVMVSDYEVEPDIRIRLVNLPGLADLVLTDQAGSSKFTFCRSATRYRSTTLFVAKFVTQPDVIITLNKNDRHADYTLYVESENVSNIEAAALFWLALRQQK